MRAKRLLPFVITVLVVGGLLPSPSLAVNAVVDSYPTWQRAASALDPEGTIYRPSFRAGLQQDSRIDILAFKRITKSGNTKKYSSMLVTGSYKNRLGSFSLMEKFAKTKWAARRVADPGQRIVAQPIIKMNATGVKVRAIIYANCAVLDSGAALESKNRCSKADVKSFGGLLVLDTPEETSIIIESIGLTFQQIIGIARGLRPLEVGN